MLIESRIFRKGEELEIRGDGAFTVFRVLCVVIFFLSLLECQ